ncbi:type IV toxin-antitoxin system AbiEi family antitoxin domain-containing protein [candidate division TA06 bacterium]|nr:type IV toxin-antitoxin system AbiEi family antitoxin domain-containing protein [candidate division TA06 bacterium]
MLWKNMHFKYTKSKVPGGISEKNRRLLDALHREQNGPFTITDVAKSWSMDRTRVGRLLAYWASRGWLSRIRKGLYITVPLGAMDPAKRREDPWIVATRIFGPCYIGGWSACDAPLAPGAAWDGRPVG